MSMRKLITFIVITLFVGSLTVTIVSTAESQKTAKSINVYAEHVKQHEWSRYQLFNPASIKITDTSKYKKKPPYTIAYANCGVTNSWGVQSESEFKYRAQKYIDKGIIKKIFISDAQEKPDKQISDLEDLVSKGVDAICIRAKSEAALDPIVTRLHNQGIPIICASRRVVSDNFVSFVTSSLKAEGRLQTIWLAQMLKGRGNIVILGGIPGAGAGEERKRSQYETLSFYPDIKILDFQYCHWHPAKAKEIMAAWIQSFGNKIDGVLAESGPSTVGAMEAMVEAKFKKVPVTGDFINGYLKRVLQYKFPGVAISYPIALHGEMVDVAVRVLQGIPVPFEYEMQSLITTTVDTKDVRADIPWSKAARLDKGDDLWCDTSLPEEMLPK